MFPRRARSGSKGFKACQRKRARTLRRCATGRSNDSTFLRCLYLIMLQNPIRLSQVLYKQYFRRFTVLRADSLWNVEKLVAFSGLDSSFFHLFLVVRIPPRHLHIKSPRNRLPLPILDKLAPVKLVTVDPPIIELGGLSRTGGSRGVGPILRGHHSWHG